MKEIRSLGLICSWKTEKLCNLPEVEQLKLVDLSSEQACKLHLASAWVLITCI